MTTNKDKDTVVLNQIDKIYTNLTNMMQTMNRLGIFGVVLSLIIIALSFGLVSAGQQLTIIGLTITVPLWLFILGSTWVTGVMFVYYHILDAYREKLVTQIIELYGSIGLTIEDMESFPHSFNFILMTTFPQFLISNKSNFNKVINLIITLAIALFIMVIPMIAQIIAYYKVLSLIGGVGWVIVSLIIQFVITVPFFIASFINAPKMRMDVFENIHSH